MYYLAYGSNLHPYRLSKRLPTAELVGVTSLQGLQLAFHKRSRDGSAKCMYVETGSADDHLHAAIYRIARQEKLILDSIEGLGQGYDEANHRVRLDGTVLDTFAYAAAPTHVEPGLKPFDWYREMVLLGAEYHGFPATLSAFIRTIETMPDPDAARGQEKADLCTRMRDINKNGSHSLTAMALPIP